MDGGREVVGDDKSTSGEGVMEGISKFRWYGFDIDGTIADNSLHSWVIDEPIEAMVEKMKELHEAGADVRILSGRLGDYPSDEEIPQGVKEHIWGWCDEHLGFRPVLTGRKDSLMEYLYDDRAKQVVCNKGVEVEEVAKGLARVLEEVMENPSERAKREAKVMLRRCREYGML